VPITDQSSKLKVLTPTEDRLDQLKAAVGPKNLKRKGVNQRMQEHKEREEEWPQVIVE